MSKELQDHLRTLSNKYALPKDHFNYLKKLKKEGFEPKVIYDIGSCVLDWYNHAKILWPDAHYVLFDANEKVEFLYKDLPVQYYIGLLSSDKKQLEYYYNDYQPGGNSHYKETTETKFSVIMKESNTLEEICLKNGFPKPDLIKMDVQGSEKDIIKGSVNLIKECKHLIIEVQKIEYNEGAPKDIEVLPYIESLGFECVAPLFCNNGPDGDYGFKSKSVKDC